MQSQLPTRQQIREQLGVLEEKLEGLGALAASNERMSLLNPDSVVFGTEILFHEALESLHTLGHLVHEQQLTKSVAAQDFLQRIISLLVQDAAAQGCEIAVSHYGEGKISMEMAELVMGAIVAGFRASLRSQKALDRAERARLHLFAPGSIYIEVRASVAEVQFRLIDDGSGFQPDGSGLSLGAEKQFDKLREHIARCGGWFGRASLGVVGGSIEFKVPLAHNRLDALLLRSGDFEVLLPAACVVETIEPGHGRAPDDAMVLRLSEVNGLEPGPAEGCLLRVGVADIQFWISCEAVGSRVQVRRASAGEFTDQENWLQCFGLFHEGGAGRALPLFEGTTLIRFHKACSSQDRTGGNT